MSCARSSPSTAFTSTNDPARATREAKAAETKALADAKLGKQVGEAAADAAADKREADHKVAVVKCNALAGDAKAACLGEAQAKLGRKG